MDQKIKLFILYSAIFHRYKHRLYYQRRAPIYKKQTLGYYLAQHPQCITSCMVCIMGWLYKQVDWISILVLWGMCRQVGTWPGVSIHFVVISSNVSISSSCISALPLYLPLSALKHVTYKLSYCHRARLIAVFVHAMPGMVHIILHVILISSAWSVYYYCIWCHLTSFVILYISIGMGSG